MWPMRASVAWKSSTGAKRRVRSPKAPDGEDLGGEHGHRVVLARRCVCLKKTQRLADLNLARRPNQRSPQVFAGVMRVLHLLGEEDFYQSAGLGRVVLGACAAAGGKETRGQDAGVVQNEEIAGLEEVGEVGEEVVAQGPGCSVEDQHAARSALGRRVLGDEFCGQVEAEVGDKHWRSLIQPQALGFSLAAFLGHRDGAVQGGLDARRW
jgi:hypothetical protein